MPAQCCRRGGGHRCPCRSRAAYVKNHRSFTVCELPWAADAQTLVVRAPAATITVIRVELSTARSARPSADARGERYEIGDVATLVTLSLRTVRFYEQEGLLVPVDRTADGFPLYDDDALDRFFLIKKMKPLGFTVEEMRSLLTLRERIGRPELTAANRAELHDRLRTWVSLAEEKLAALQEQVRLAEDFMIGLKDDAARSLRVDGELGEDPLGAAARGLDLDDSFLDFLTDPLGDGPDRTSTNTLDADPRGPENTGEGGQPGGR
ncbi:MerR family transcriptional regulator [Frankia sp. AgKG'84/4]|uniref:MerR family transcriptional regulator n=1 Tax=Frankia sp. AgKG'84/4 TaxID=573490 RepID=UPI0027E4D111|nr:MerR family transcriptional regulator [Frankia sp. AgKG'84/4]